MKRLKALHMPYVKSVIKLKAVAISISRLHRFTEINYIYSLIVR